MDTAIDQALINDMLRYCRQVVLKTMDSVRGRMRGSDRLLMKEIVANGGIEKSEQNLTKAVDKEAEDIVIRSVRKKFSKLGAVKSFVIFSEEAGILTTPEGTDPKSCEWVVFVDPIDGTEFIESLQGGWCLLAVYNRKVDRVVVAVAGDIFLNRLYWASSLGEAEALDFVTHSWFKLDGGAAPKKTLKGARVNFLTTKVSRFLSVAKQERLLKEIEKHDGRINLSWGSNLLIQVAAGYADVAIEFTKGFAAYDILPGLCIAERAGLTILDLKGDPITSQIDIDAVFDRLAQDSKNPHRLTFVAAKHPELAHAVVDLLDS